jgi:DNA-binding response OmpR family regulator
MALTAYLLSSDKEMLNKCKSVLNDVGVTVQESTSVDEAGEFLEKTKFDTLVFDFDLPRSDEALRFARRGANKKSTVFGVVGSPTAVKQAFDMGVNFVMSKPLEIEQVTTSFRAALNAILRDRRQHFRYHIDGQAAIIDGDAQVFRGEIANVSEGGILIQLCERLKHASKVTVRFELPNGKSIEAKGEVVWSDPESGTGIHFLFMSSVSKHDLDNWIVEQLVTQQKPEPKIWKPEAAKV